MSRLVAGLQDTGPVQLEQVIEAHCEAWGIDPARACELLGLAPPTAQGIRRVMDARTMRHIHEREQSIDNIKDPVAIVRARRSIMRQCPRMYKAYLGIG